VAAHHYPKNKELSQALKEAFIIIAPHFSVSFALNKFKKEPVAIPITCC
jgi:hypothetical protein